MKNVTVDHAAQIIGVSSATIRNWVKSGQIHPVSARPLSFSAESILSLKESIGSASFSRLKTRANKIGSANSFMPEEYAENKLLISAISQIIALLKEKNLDIEYIMFLASLRVLETHNEIKQLGHEKLNFNTYGSWARDAVKSIIIEWHSTLDKNINNKSENEAYYDSLYSLITPHDADDFLGLLYQSIFKEGNKSEQGSYYTPSTLVKDALSYMKTPVETFLDPCCGTGKYLLMAAKKFNLAPENIYGFDCDKIAIYIAKINLLLAYKEVDFVPNIYCLDSLSELATGQMFCQTNHLMGKIDAVATNPPWGAYKNSTLKNKNLATVKSGETFSLFLEKSIQLLRQGGQLSFILPESILNIKAHADIRELIITDTTIKNISLLGRQFTGVFTPVIRLDIVKETASNSCDMTIENNGKISYIKQARFKNNSQFTFDVATESPEQEVLLNKIYAIKHLTLSKNAQWALGIVTGDNKKYVLDDTIKGAEAVFRGSDVFQYSLGKPTSYIIFTPENFQQVAPETFFRMPEKLIYKFISKKLVFAYDNCQQLTLNSANILIPTIPNMGIKTALAFLNSRVFQYLFKKKFATHKVLRGDLEKLPFPIVDEATQVVIERLVEEAITTQHAPKQLDDLIFKIFQLNEAEISIIKQTAGD